MIIIKASLKDSSNCFYYTESYLHYVTGKFRSRRGKFDVSQVPPLKVTAH